jgi:hypothetical protein
MAEQTNEPDASKVTPAAPQFEGQHPETEPPKGSDDKVAAQKYREQRDKARADLDELQKQLETFKGTAEEVDKLKKQAQEQQEAFDAERQAVILAKARAVLLAGAGCVSIDDALELWKEGDDVEEFKKAKPWLFKTQPQGSTGAKPTGATADSEAQLAEYRKAAGLKTKE